MQAMKIVGAIGVTSAAGMVARFLCCAALLTAPAAWADPVHDIAVQAVGASSTPVEKTTRLVQWLHHNLQWSATDYQKRTVAQILERRAGNCADLARVLKAMLAEVGVQYRWMAELNIQPADAEREQRSSEYIKTRGKRFSAFGLRHNDHRWLEIYDDATREWIPADAATGLVGTRNWIAARMAFENRPQSDIPAIVEISREMIVPFSVLALSPTEDTVVEKRYQHYLIEEFNRYYGGKLETLPSWGRWKQLVAEFADPAAEMFAGKFDLHQKQASIDEVAKVYESLRSEALRAKLKPAPV